MKKLGILFVLMFSTLTVFAAEAERGKNEEIWLDEVDLSDGTITYAQFPITKVSGNSRGLVNGSCRLTLQKMSGKLALTVAFNHEGGQTSGAIASILMPTESLPLGHRVVSEDETGTRNLTYIDGVAILNDSVDFERLGNITNFNITTDRELETIHKIKVIFFEDVKNQGRNETGSAECAPAGF